MTLPIFQFLLKDHMDAIITSENIFGSSSIDAVIFNFGSLIWMLLLSWRTFLVG